MRTKFHGNPTVVKKISLKPKKKKIKKIKSQPHGGARGNGRGSP